MSNENKSNINKKNVHYPSSTPPRNTSHLCLPFLNGLLLTLFWVSRLILMILNHPNDVYQRIEKNVTGFVPGQQTNATVILTFDYQKSISDIWFRSSQFYFRLPTFNFSPSGLRTFDSGVRSFISDHKRRIFLFPASDF